MEKRVKKSIQFFFLVKIFHCSLVEQSRDDYGLIPLTRKRLFIVSKASVCQLDEYFAYMCI